MTMLAKFAAIIGGDLIIIPYASQQVTPAKNIANILKDMSCTDFVFIILISCGIKPLVVKIAAIKPKMSMMFIIFPVLVVVSLTLKIKLIYYTFTHVFSSI